MKKEILVEKINVAIRFFLYLLIFWVPYSTAAIESCVIIALVLWIIKRCIVGDFSRLKNLPLEEKIAKCLKNFKPVDNFLNKPIGFFLIICVFSSLLSQQPIHAVSGFITKTLEWFVIYFLVLETMRTEKQLTMALKVFIFTSLAVIVDGMIQYYYVTHKDIFFGNILVAEDGVNASFKTRNDLGGYLTFVVPLMLSLVFLKTAKILKALFAGFFIFAAWCLVFTLSRGAWVATCVGSVFLLFLLNRKLAISILILLPVFVLYFLTFAPGETKDFLRLTANNNPNNLFSISWRLDIWQHSIKMIFKKPFLGYGLNTYMTIFHNTYLNANGGPICWPTYAHNCFIQIAFETGLLGLGGFLWILYELFNNTLKKIKVLISGHQKNFVILSGLLAGALAFLIHSFFDTHFYSLQLSTLFWYMTGLLVAFYKVDTRKDYA